MIPETKRFVRDGASPLSGLSNFYDYMDAQKEVRSAQEDDRSDHDLIRQDTEESLPKEVPQPLELTTDNRVHNSQTTATPCEKVATTSLHTMAPVENRIEQFLAIAKEQFAELAMTHLPSVV